MEQVVLAEKSLLGTMLADNTYIADTLLMPAHFATHQHRFIFSQMQHLQKSGHHVDYITLLTTAEPQALGGANYLQELTYCANPEKFTHYQKALLTHWRYGQKHKILHQAQTMDWEVDAIFQALEAISLHQEPMCLPIQPDLEALKNLPFEPRVSRGVMTGLADLDRALNGFQPKELTLIAARPSMGKTDVMNHFARTAAQREHTVLVFSLEMARQTIIERQIAAEGNYNRLKMRDPYLHFTEGQKASWGETLGKMMPYDLYINDRAGLTVAEIQAQARHIIRRSTKRPIIFIDYIQLIRPSESLATAAQMMGAISWGLKQLAKELDCPVVVLSQLSRSVEQRQDKRPVLSDLRDSGNLEQDADVVMFLYRDSYYERTNDETLELHIAKHRNGPTGKVAVHYQRATGVIRSG